VDSRKGWLLDVTKNETALLDVLFDHQAWKHGKGRAAANDRLRQLQAIRFKEDIEPSPMLEAGHL
jgi:hypothetical protein